MDQSVNSSVTQALRSKAVKEFAGPIFQKVSRSQLVKSEYKRDLGRALSAKVLLSSGTEAFQEISQKALSNYKLRDLPNAALRKALSNLLASNTNEKLLKDVSAVLETYISRGFKLTGFLESAAALSACGLNKNKSSPALIEAFSFGYQWLEIQVKNFREFERLIIVPEITQAINGGLEPAALLPLCSILSNTTEYRFSTVANIFKALKEEQKAGGLLKADADIFYKVAVSAGLDFKEFSRFINVYHSVMRDLKGRKFRREEAYCGKRKEPLLSIPKFRQEVLRLAENGIADTRFLKVLNYYATERTRSPLQLSFLTSVRIAAAEIWEQLEPNVPRLNESTAVESNLINGLEGLTNTKLRSFNQAVDTRIAWNTDDAMNLLYRLCLETKVGHHPRSARPSEEEVKLLLASAGVDGRSDKGTALTELSQIVDKICNLRRNGRDSVVREALKDHRSIRDYSPASLRALKTLVDLHGESAPRSAINLFIGLAQKLELETGNLLDRALEIVRLVYLSNPNYLSTFARRLHDSNYSLLDYARGSKEVAIKSLVDRYNRTPDDMHGARWDSLDSMARTARANVHISEDFPKGTLELAQKVVHLQGRINAYHEGFLGLSADAEHRHLKSGPMMLERFAKSVGQYQKIHSNDIDGNPGGPGILISRMEMDRILIPDLDRQGDKFHHYKSHWPQYNDVIDKMQHVHFGLTRGWLAVSAPRDSLCGIDFDFNNGSELWHLNHHYSLVIFNDHHGSLAESAFLVDTQLFAKLLHPTTYEPEISGPEVPGVSDINSTSLSAARLTKMQDKFPHRVLNVGSGSNIAGGFMHSFGTSSPLFEILPLASENPFDNEFGHPNYRWKNAYPDPIAGSYLRAPLDTAISQIVSTNLNYLDLLMVGLSQYKKGYVFEKSEMSSESRGSDEYKMAEVIKLQSQPPHETRDPRVLRLLEEARAYRADALNRELRSDEFRVLGLAPVENPSAGLQSDVFLDTESEVLYAGGDTYQMNLDAGEISDEDRSVWYERVVPHFNDYFTTMRFYKKSSLVED